jgi:hypothetical protein
MNLLIGAFFNAAILALAAVVVGVLFGRLHPLVDLLAHFLLPAIVGAIAMALLAAFAGRTGAVLIFLGLGAATAALAWPCHPKRQQQPARASR